MGSVLGLVSLVLLAMQLLLVARMILDWTMTLAGPSADGSVRSRLTTGVYRVTEPILAPVRRVIPPVRVGGMSFDLAFIVLFVAIVVVRRLIA